MYMQQAYKKRVVERGEEIILSILRCAVQTTCDKSVE